MDFDLCDLEFNARDIRLQISDRALQYLTEQVCCMAIVHAISQEYIPQESFLIFSMISGLASSEADSRRWVTRTPSE